MNFRRTTRLGSRQAVLRVPADVSPYVVARAGYMSEIDPRADSPLVDWSDLGVSGLLPTGTVTLLLADVEGSTLLWETQPDDMAAAVARLERTLSDVVGAYGGVRPVEQGKGDSFVAAFARASDAVACALELQRAPLAPIRLRMATNGTTRRGVIACGSAAAVLAGWATGRFR